MSEYYVTSNIYFSYDHLDNSMTQERIKSIVETIPDPFSQWKNSLQCETGNFGTVKIVSQASNPAQVELVVWTVEYYLDKERNG